MTARSITGAWAGIFALCAVACGGSDEMAAPPAEDFGCDGLAAYANPGPYPVGVTTLDLDGVPVEVWYPGARAGTARDVYDLRDWLGDEIRQQIPDADAPRLETSAYRDVPVREGAHPLVVFSHGLGGYRSQSTFFTTHLASWGFIVAAPDHPERGLQLLISPTAPVLDRAPTTMLQTIALLEQHSASTGPFAGRVDSTRVAMAGHSAGGAASAVAAADPQVITWVGHAGAAEAPPQKPALIMAGATDETVTPSRLASNYEDLSGPALQRYVSIFGAGHLAFSDICLIGREDGGLIPLARKYDVEIPALFEALATDGCEIGDLPPQRAWPVINHYSTAHLFEALNLPDAAPGYDGRARACFGQLVLDFRQR